MRRNVAGGTEVTMATDPQTIAILFEFPSLNGGERSMLAAIDRLLDEVSRFEFVAIAPPNGPLAVELSRRKIEHIPWCVRTSNGDRIQAELIESSLLEITSQRQPHLLHGNSLSMSRLIGRLAGRLSIPTTGHLRDIIGLSAAAVADVNRNQRVIAVSHATRDYHVAQGLNPTRVTVVHNGIDLDRFQPRQPTGRLLAELHLTSSTENPVKLVATIGQIGLRKGQDVLAAAAKSIVDRVPQTHFLIIGERNSQKTESIEFERSIQQAFEQCGLSQHLHLLGYRHDVDRMLNEIDLLVHSANQEPFGRVLLEATAAGVPIVATDVGGTNEIVVDGQTGRLVPARDPGALANAVVSTLTEDGLAMQFRIAARRRAITEFSIATAAERLADVWRQTLRQ